MNYQVIISEQAEQDLRAVYEYIAFEKESPDIAKALLDRLEEQILKLDDMPYRFREYELEPWRSRGLRVMPVESYLVCYIPRECDRTVNVIRVFYTGQNIDKHLNKTKH